MVRFWHFCLKLPIHTHSPIFWEECWGHIEAINYVKEMCLVHEKITQSGD